MVCDVVGTMDAFAGAGEDAVLRAMLSRIRAWQEFMRRTPRGLSPEAEVDLAGELAFLDLLLGAGMNASSAVESWLGPDRGIQDFEIGSGSVEVKLRSPVTDFRPKSVPLNSLTTRSGRPCFLRVCALSRAGLAAPSEIWQVLCQKSWLRRQGLRQILRTGWWRLAFRRPTTEGIPEGFLRTR